jgi:hypothetical protein
VDHAHTTASGGANTREEMAEACMAGGHGDLGISDQSQTAPCVCGLKPTEIEAQHDKIDWLNDMYGARFCILKGMEGALLVPASHFFEFTGSRIPKSKWRFTRAGEDWFRIAGLWRPMPEGGDAFTTLRTEPGPDVAPIHNRQIVVLERSDWRAWLELEGSEAELLRPLPAGSLTVEQVR